MMLMIAFYVVGVDGVAVGGFGNADNGFIFIIDDFKPYL